MNQQRTKTDDRGVRRETPASRWAVSLIHGALKTHPNLLVLSRGRPEMVVTDGHLDLIDFEDPREATWTCDLLLMPQGINGQYNLAIEIKTSASAPSHEPFTVFAHAMGLERNRFQMSKITGLNKPWWYVVVLIDKLTASTDEEYASRMWSCPTIWYQGQPGASFPSAALGPKPLSEVVVEMRNSLPLERAEKILPSQQDQAESATYTLNDELKQRPSRPPEDDQWFSGKSIPSESIFYIAPYINRVVDNVGIETFIERATPSAVAVFEKLKLLSKSSNGFIDPYNNIVHAVGYATRTRRGQREVEVAKHIVSSEAILLGIAIATTTESNRFGAMGRELSRVFLEMSVRIESSGKPVNAMISATHVVLRSKR